MTFMSSIISVCPFSDTLACDIAQCGEHPKGWKSDDVFSINIFSALAGTEIAASIGGNSAVIFVIVSLWPVNGSVTTSSFVSVDLDLHVLSCYSLQFGMVVF